MLKAITRQARAVDEKVKAYNATHAHISIAYFFDHLATEEDTAVMVTEEDFIEANRELVPSVSADELKHYERVRKAFEGAGKKEEPQQRPQHSMSPNGQEQPQFRLPGSGKGKGKGKATVGVESEADDYVIRTGHLDLNGSSDNSAGKGKGKTSVNHGRAKASIDIAEGGFGDVGQDDEDMYA
jgi:peroxin-6